MIEELADRHVVPPVVRVEAEVGPRDGTGHVEHAPARAGGRSPSRRRSCSRSRRPSACHRLAGCPSIVAPGRAAEHDVATAHDGQRRPGIGAGEAIERGRGRSEGRVGDDSRPAGRAGAASSGERVVGGTVVGGTVAGGRRGRCRCRFGRRGGDDELAARQVPRRRRHPELPLRRRGASVRRIGRGQPRVRRPPTSQRGRVVAVGRAMGTATSVCDAAAAGQEYGDRRVTHSAAVRTRPVPFTPAPHRCEGTGAPVTVGRGRDRRRSSRHRADWLDGSHRRRLHRPRRRGRLLHR